MFNDYLFLITEWIGTIAFAISGSLVAISCNLDLFGVLTVGCVTAVGGGITRDLLMGVTPPQIFQNPQILLLAALTSVVVFIVSAINVRKFKEFRKKLETVNIFFDALGLAVFSVFGVETACAHGYTDNVVLVITMGVLTGVGGGVLRDVFVNEKPYILTKHVYAVASILGCLVYYALMLFCQEKLIGTLVAIVLIVTIRLLAAKYRWKLPKIHLQEE